MSALLVYPDPRWLFGKHVNARWAVVHTDGPKINQSVGIALSALLTVYSNTAAVLLRLGKCRRAPTRKARRICVELLLVL